jgi:autotransporter-associated beta strand protein
VSGGTLKLGSATAMNFNYAASVSGGAVLDLNGQSITNSLTINGTGILLGGALINSSTTAASNSGAVILASDSRVGGSGDMTLSGVVSGAFGLTKAGAGKTTLTAANTYSGVVGTAIIGGILEIGGSGTLGSGTYSPIISIASGSVFKYSSSAAQTLSGQNSGAGSLVKDTSNSTLTLSGLSSYSGGTTILAGTVKAGNAVGFGTGAITVGSSATSTASVDVAGFALANAMTLNGYGTGGSGGTVGALTNSGVAIPTLTGSVNFATDVQVGGAYALTLSGNTSGSGKLTKVGGANALTMSGSSNTDFTGDVAIVGGYIGIGGNGSFAASNAIDIASGALLFYDSTTNRTLTGLISGAGGACD